MQNYEWYQTLIKPSFAPPAFLFAPVWTFLYIVIILSFGYVFWLVAKKQAPRMTAVPFLINIVANLAFTPIQFGLKNNILAAIDITIVLITLIWAIKVIRPISKKVAIAQIPYLLWVSFATILQYTVTYLNL